MAVMTQPKGVVALMDQSFKTKIRKKNQVTLNQDLLNAIGATEGDELVWKVVDGAIVGVPTVSVPKDQLWYFRPEWQTAEQEVEAELASGGMEKTEIFRTAESLLAHLKKS